MAPDRSPRSRMDPVRFLRVAKALADLRRFEMLEAIAAVAELPCQRLRELFPVTQATVSHHLKELTTAGLVEQRSAGQFVYYRANRAALAQYTAELERRLARGARR